MAKPHQYVELNLFPEEETEQQQNSNGNNDHDFCFSKEYDLTDLFDRVSS